MDKTHFPSRRHQQEAQVQSSVGELRSCIQDWPTKQNKTTGRISAFWIRYYVTLHVPTSVHFHWLSKDFGVCHRLHSLWKCLVHSSSAQDSVTLPLCPFSVPWQAFPLLISDSPGAPSSFSRPLFSLPLSQSAPSLCHPPERDPLLMEKSSPFSFLALKPDLCLCGSIHSFCYKIHIFVPIFFSLLLFGSFTALFLFFSFLLLLFFNRCETQLKGSYSECFKFGMLPVYGPHTYIKW